ncbi:MAG: hypothetical protein ACOCSF_05410, partial [Halanaeroarchaeum sp.]
MIDGRDYLKHFLRSKEVRKARDNESRNATRRRFLTAASAVGITALAGCPTGGSENDDTTTPTTTEEPPTTENTTEETTEEPTTTEEPDKSFEEIYQETVQEPWEDYERPTALNAEQTQRYSDPEDFDSFDDMLIQIKDTILNNFSVIND